MDKSDLPVLSLSQAQRLLSSLRNVLDKVSYFDYTKIDSYQFELDLDTCIDDVKKYIKFLKYER